MSEKLNRYANIDIIRGIAALLVVWLHVSETFKSFLPSAADAWVYHVAEVVDFGRIGVVAFFAVSGFVIPASFKHPGWVGLKVFMIRRFFRLFPAFWLSVPLALWSSWYLWDKPVTLEQVCATITMLPSLFGQIPLEGLYWTLEIELLFYLLCVALFVWGKVHDTQVLALTLAGFMGIFLLSKVRVMITLPAILTVSDEVGLTTLFLAIMFWGALYRQWYDRRRVWHRWWSVVLWGVPSIIVMLIPLAFFTKMLADGYILPESIKSFASPALGLLLFIALATWRNFSMKPLNKLGEISYSLYLFHPIVFYPVYWWAGRTQSEWVRNLPLEVWVLTMMLASIAVAYVIFRWVERPMMDYGNMMSKTGLRVAV